LAAMGGPTAVTAILVVIAAVLIALRFGRR
jgi:hypothetical protein